MEVRHAQLDLRNCLEINVENSTAKEVSEAVKNYEETYLNEHDEIKLNFSRVVDGKLIQLTSLISFAMVKDSRKIGLDAIEEIMTAANQQLDIEPASQ